jgi:dihydrofolate reductase
VAVIGDITMSVDGFVTGPDAGVGAGLGRGGERLHAWAIESEDPVDRALLEELTAASGAVVMGRRTFDVVDAPDGWSAERGYGADQAGRPPFFVVTSTAPETVRLAGTHDFTFVTAGPAAAVDRARAAAGGRDVYVMGGGMLVGSCLRLSLLDRLHLHVSAEVLGAGTPLFAEQRPRPLRQREVRVSPVATHLFYDVP